MRAEEDMAAVWGEDVLKIGAGEPDVFSRMIKDVMAQERHAVYLLTGTQKSVHAFLSDPDKSGVESGADRSGGSGCVFGGS